MTPNLKARNTFSHLGPFFKYSWSHFLENLKKKLSKWMQAPTYSLTVSKFNLRGPNRKHSPFLELTFQCLVQGRVREISRKTCQRTRVPLCSQTPCSLTAMKVFSIYLPYTRKKIRVLPVRLFKIKN